MVYRLVRSEIGLLGLFLWDFIELGIANGTRRGWSFSIQLFFSVPVGCPVREIYVTGLTHDLNCGEKLHITNYYRIPAGRRRKL